jgi:hypothetical protein
MVDAGHPLHELTPIRPDFSIGIRPLKVFDTYLKTGKEDLDKSPKSLIKAFR